MSARRNPARVRIRSRHQAKRQRQGKELTRLDDVMTVEGVARFLHCSVQSVRNVPVTDLPKRRGPGRRILYLREDVIAYLRRSQKPARDADKLLSDIESELLESPPDSGRGRSQKKGTQHANQK